MQHARFKPLKPCMLHVCGAPKAERGSAPTHVVVMMMMMINIIIIITPRVGAHMQPRPET